VRSQLALDDSTVLLRSKVSLRKTASDKQAQTAVKASRLPIKSEVSEGFGDDKFFQFTIKNNVLEFGFGGRESVLILQILNDYL
jgi:hypothetical protein